VAENKTLEYKQELKIIVTPTSDKNPTTLMNKEISKYH
jgi:hypothetical protein